MRKQAMMRLKSRVTNSRLAFVFVLGFAAVVAPSVQGQTFAVIHTFSGGSDGATPLAGFVIDGLGNFYGTASSGGSYGAGVVFKMNTSGEETVLHNFAGGTDGSSPEASLVMDTTRNLYGTNTGGPFNAGTVFEITRTGKERVLHSFAGGADGANPVAGLAIDKAGNLYGTTTAGGSSGSGIVFMLAVPTVAGGAWTEKVLHSFGTVRTGRFL
jgi:uncharacterized repeat protein (TIGR03803 family)